MTRDELVAHCKRMITEYERLAAIKGEEISGSKVYNEHKFILTLLTQPEEHEISLADAVRLAEQGDSQEQEQVEKLVKPEPFINKPCVSEQACHEDKMRIIGKIKADVINIADGRRSIPVSSVMRIIDKHKGESEE